MMCNSRYIVKVFFFYIEKISHCGARCRINKVSRKGKICTHENRKTNIIRARRRAGERSFRRFVDGTRVFQSAALSLLSRGRVRKYKLRVATRRRRLLFPRRESTGYFPSRRRGADGPLSALFTRSPTSIGTIPLIPG